MKSEKSCDVKIAERSEVERVEKDSRVNRILRNSYYVVRPYRETLTVSVLQCFDVLIVSQPGLSQP